MKSCLSSNRHEWACGCVQLVAPSIPSTLSAAKRGEHGASSERRLLRFLGSRTLNFGCCSLEITGHVPKES
jgi:hypothetical protein